MKNSDRVPGLRVSLVRDAGVESKPLNVSTAQAAAELVRKFIPAGDEREHFVAVLLDARNSVKGVSVVSIGTLSASLIHPREVFRAAIVAGAAGIIIAHNHPSFDTSPSVEDKSTTKRLAEAGRLLGIPLVDHVIIGESGAFFSFRERGLL